jgi:hypothetical protein
VSMLYSYVCINLYFDLTTDLPGRLIQVGSREEILITVSRVSEPITVHGIAPHVSIPQRLPRLVKCSCL